MKKIYIILIIIVCNINSFAQILTVSKDGKSDYKTIQEAVNNINSIIVSKDGEIDYKTIQLLFALKLVLLSILDLFLLFYNP